MLTGFTDDDLPSLDEATFSVDALVSDDLPPTRPHSSASLGPPGLVNIPAPPPGLGHPHAHPPPGLRSPLAGTPLAGSPIAARAVVLPVTPKKPVVAPVEQSAKQPPANAASEIKKNIKALAQETGISKTIAGQAKSAKSKKILQDEDFPALDAKSTAPPTPVTTASTPLKTPAAAAPKAGAERVKVPPSETKKAVKKATPMPMPVLNIAAATKAAQTKVAADSASANEKSAQDMASAFPALPTPSTAVSSPIARSGPKTLRVVPTPKNEAAPAIFGAAGSDFKPVLERSSVISSLNRPGTPSSEVISDNVSVLSASLPESRASSPPPSRIGSAAVRTKTKSQTRKERKQATKLEAASIASQPVPEVDEEIGPILGRKKKQKKEPKESKPSTSTSSATASSSQTAKQDAEKKSTVSEEKVAQTTKAAKQAAPVVEAKPPRVQEVTPLIPSPSPGTATTESGQKLEAENVPITPLSIVQALLQSGDLANPAEIALLKPFAGLSYKYDFKDAQDGRKEVLDPNKSAFDDEDHAVLLDGEIVRKTVDGIRMLLTPNGNCVRNLSQEEEDRYVELQQLVAEAAATAATYVHPRHETTGGFSLVKGRAVPNGVPGYFPPAVGSLPQDPIGKIQREEAIYYINQYVLPRLNLGSTNLASGVRPVIPTTAMAPFIYNGDETEFAPGHTHDMADRMGHSPSALSSLADIDLPNMNMNMIPGTASPIPGAGTSFGTVPLMAVDEAERALSFARKETERLEKNLHALMKRNRRLLTSNH